MTAANRSDRIHSDSARMGWQVDESSVAELKTWFDQHGDTKWANFAGEVNTKSVAILRDHIPLQFLLVLPEF
jgi:hypothetical protein